MDVITQPCCDYSYSILIYIYICTYLRYELFIITIAVHAKLTQTILVIIWHDAALLDVKKEP